MLGIYCSTPCATISNKGIPIKVTYLWWAVHDTYLASGLRAARKQDHASVVTACNRGIVHFPVELTLRLPWVFKTSLQLRWCPIQTLPPREGPLLGMQYLHHEVSKAGLQVHINIHSVEQPVNTTKRKTPRDIYLVISNRIVR